MVQAPGVAVQRLNPRHREDIARYLLRLPAEDRRLRFGRAVRDEAIREYVEGIDFERDRVFGIHTPGLELTGVARLALDRRSHGGALKETIADQFALVDCMLKQQYLWLARPGRESARAASGT